MKRTINFLKQTPMLLLLVFILGGASACNKHSCPANNGGYMDSKKVLKSKRHKKPQSGLFPKGMRHH